MQNAQLVQQPHAEIELDNEPNLDVTYTSDEYRAYAEQEARNMLGVTLSQALEMVDRGELEGTLAEARLRLIRSML